jgi:mannan endo-1,4-beta-mannosidase
VPSSSSPRSPSPPPFFWRLQLLQTGPISDPDAFVEVKNGEFVLGCSTFPISGINLWEVLEAGAGAPMLTGSQLKAGMVSTQALLEAYDTAVRSGFTVVRAWAHGVTPEYATMDKDGEYNEGLLRGLDFAIAEARKRGLKLILSFTSNWTPAGGVDQIAEMAGGSHNDFFTDEQAKSIYKKYVENIITRTNTITGQKYSDDPTIMSWNVINEPVCRNCPSGTLAAWIKEMAAHVKSLDSNHLLTVGEEGFYRTTTASLGANPGSWAAEYDQDFVVDHSDPNIDFATMHGWPDQWKVAGDLNFWKTWIQTHIDDAAALGKPLIFEEFGKQSSQRTEYYQIAYDAVEESLRSGGPLKGALFWQLYVDGQTASQGEGGGAGEFGVYEGDAAFDIAVANAAVVKELATEVTECSSQASPLSLPECPEGYEGPSCDIDINECTRGTAGCGTGAVCINAPGSFECACPLGSTGSGTSACDDSAAATGLNSFEHDPEGQACDAGEDVAWPREAAGWVEDTTGYYESQSWRTGPGFDAGALGARGKVTAAQCAAACLAAEGCTSFTYNDVQEGCFLKTGQCAERNSCKEEELICKSVNDRGQEISVPCGSWATYYLKSAIEEICATVPAPSAVAAAGRR